MGYLQFLQITSIVALKMAICWFPEMGIPQNGWFIRENPSING
jgi:hypothetical protein